MEEKESGANEDWSGDGGKGEDGGKCNDGDRGKNGTGRMRQKNRLEREREEGW